ncbi:MAG: putative selenate reductase subunit YgfK [Clostridiales bacterium]|nr:putative selenate reductase subunit YgfK [Candidatus Crickella caballi]
MSDIMRPISYEHLLNWVLDEYNKSGSIFGVSKLVKRTDGEALPIFEEKIETPFGPAAGPNTQLAQNIIASYCAGSRFFELKTVQDMDGAELAACVAKPCITAHDECYNCEWSTELYVHQAFDEYVKAWFVCKILAKELGLGDPDGFVFNMSVGYDLEGIKKDKVNTYIDGMKDASNTEVFKNAMEVTLQAVKDGKFKNVDEAFVKSIPSRISDSITESTLHGCPPDEIERIASYLIKEKNLNTFIKCNPTLLGYEFARERLDSLGFDYIAFDDHHFLEDLQWADAVPMFERLQALCDEKGLEFGVKLTNTFPVDVKAGELPSEEMYMSGRSLFPLTIELARRITKQFDGKLRISFSGGADYFNIKEIFEAGIWPITMATTVLKPGGYQRMSQIADRLGNCGSKKFDGVDLKQVEALVEMSQGERNRKPIKPLPERKNGEELPMFDCFTAPCSGGCPINQDIPAYLEAMEEGRSEDALNIILEKNALPFTTGTICPHTCADRCMRNHYETALKIREVKLMAAEDAYKAVLPTLKAGAELDKKVAVIGGGPAGLATASFLSRAGADVTVFEKNDKMGGVPRYVIPGFRISEEAIDNDVALCSAYGAKMVTGREIKSVQELADEGFTDVVVCIGAWAHGRKALKYGEALDALEFLAAVKAAPGSVDLGTDVAVIGGGNTAMDVARAAKVQPGVENVRLVYRRNRRNMPADEEELQMALDDGVEFMELLAPEGVENGMLKCEVCVLGEPDESGRRSPVGTGKFAEVPATAVIAAVGEQIKADIYEAAGAELDAKGRPVVDEKTLMTTVPGLYAAGDCRRGPATVVKAIADAQAITAAITGVSFDKYEAANAEGKMDKLIDRKGNLADPPADKADDRCLGCSTVCEVCADVCPNRANVVIEVPGLSKAQILHVDGMCNECGNCAIFCPYSGRPFKNKFTLFWSEEDFNDSENNGFLPLEGTKVRVRLFGEISEHDIADSACSLPTGVLSFIKAVEENYGYLIG